MRSPSATTSARGPSGHQGRGAGGSLSGAMASAGCSGGAGMSSVASGCMPHRNPLILSGLYSHQRPERPVGRQISVSRSVSCSLRALRDVRGHSWSRPGNHADRPRKAVKQKAQAVEAPFGGRVPDPESPPTTVEIEGAHAPATETAARGRRTGLPRAGHQPRPFLAATHHIRWRSPRRGTTGASCRDPGCRRSPSARSGAP